MSLTTGIYAESSEMNSEVTLCRLCMKNNRDYYNIFASNIASQLTVEDALYDLIGLRVVLGDGLPVCICAVCFGKLMEFNDFKKICYESDAELRKTLSRNYFKSSQGDGAAVVKVEYPDESQDCIQDVTDSTSQLERTVQPNEIYIPVPKCQSSGDNALFHVKEEKGDPLSEGDYPDEHAPAPSEIAGDVFDPLATHGLPVVSTATQTEGVECPEAIVPDLEWKLDGVKKEPCEEETGVDEQPFTGNGRLNDSWTTSHESMAEEVESSSCSNSLAKTSRSGAGTSSPILWRTSMAGNKCHFHGCSSSRQRTPCLRFYKFPLTGSERRNKWIAHSGNRDLRDLSPKSLHKKNVCGKHFCSRDVLPSGRLVKGAIPLPHDHDNAVNAERGEVEGSPAAPFAGNIITYPSAKAVRKQPLGTSSETAETATSKCTRDADATIHVTPTTSRSTSLQPDSACKSQKRVDSNSPTSSSAATACANSVRTIDDSPTASNENVPLENAFRASGRVKFQKPKKKKRKLRCEIAK